MGLDRRNNKSVVTSELLNDIEILGEILENENQRNKNDSEREKKKRRTSFLLPS